jgi:flagellar hook-associated protein 2
MSDSTSSSITTTTSSSGTKRVSGLYSGMDVDAMVSASLTNEQNKIDTANKNLQYAQWKKEAYEDVNSAITEFQNKYFSSTSSSSILLSSKLNTKTTTLSRETSAFTVSASASAVVNNFSVVSTQVATYAKVNSAQIANTTGMTDDNGETVSLGKATLAQIAKANGVDGLNTVDFNTKTSTNSILKIAAPTDDDPDATTNISIKDSYGDVIAIGKATIAQIADTRGVTLNTHEVSTTNDETGETTTKNVITLNINGKDVDIDADGTIDNMLSTINNTEGLNVKASFDSTAGTFTFESTERGGNVTVSGSDGLFATADGTGLLEGMTDGTKQYIQINIETADVDDDGNETNNKVTTINIDANGTLTDMMSAINNANTGVKATYNELTDKFSFTSTTIGGKKISISQAGDDDGFLFNSSGTGLLDQNMSSTGKNSEIVIKDEDGATKTYHPDGNQLTVGGFTFAITGDMSADEGEVGVTTESNVDDMVSRIKDFVTGYNDLVTKLTNLVTETRNYDYEPLTDAEKEEASDSEIEKLEAEAKKGLLYGDSNISSLLRKMRSSLNSIENSTGLKLRDIGISTGNYFTTEVQGTLEIDEDKLRAAIEADPDGVTELFTKSTTTNADGTTSGGIATTLSTYTKQFVKNCKNVTLTNWDKRISTYEDKLEKLKDLFADREDELYTQFSQLEVLLAQMDASSSMFYSS